MYINECRRLMYVNDFACMGFHIIKDESDDDKIVLGLKGYDNYRVIITVFGRNGCNVGVRWFEKGSLDHHTYECYKRVIFEESLRLVDIQCSIMDEFRKWRDESCVRDGC